MINKKTERIILAALCLVLTAVYAFFGSLKTYIHMDEGYSMGLVNYTRVDIDDGEDFYDTWHDSLYYDDYLVVNSDESGDFSAVYENQRDDVHPPFYYLLLRVAMEFSVDRFSLWPGLILGIVIGIASALTLYRISKRFFENTLLALAVTAVTSLSYASVSTVLYIRMYGLSALLILLTVLTHLRLEEKPTVGKFVTAGILALIGSLTHYHFLFFLGAIAVLYAVRRIKKKEWRELKVYIIAMATAGILSLLIFPYSIYHMFFGYRGAGSMSSFAGSGVFSKLLSFFEIANDNAFNFTLIFVLVGIALAVIVGIKIKKEKYDFKMSALVYLLIPTAVFFIVVALSAPYRELRYLMPICPLLTMEVAFVLYASLRRVSGKRIAAALLAVFALLFGAMPLIKGQEPQMLYRERSDAVDFVSSHGDLPTLFSLNGIDVDERFLDDIYLFRMIDNSYVAHNMVSSPMNIRKIFDGVDTSKGIIMFINEGQDHFEVLENTKDALKLKYWEHISHLNACDLYYIHN